MEFKMDKNVVFRGKMTLGLFGRIYSRKAYGVSDIVKEFGGLLAGCMHVLQFLMVPFSKYSFVLTIATRLFYINSGNNPLFKYK